MKKYSIPVSLMALLLLIGGACSKDTEPTPDMQQKNENQAIEEQTEQTGAIFIDEKNFTGSSVVLREVHVSTYPAWLVIYENNNGQPGRPLNYVYIEEDENFNVEVTLPNAQAGDRVSALLHLDTGKNKFFDFPEADPSFNEMNAVTFMLTPISE